METGVYQVSLKKGFRPCPTCKNQVLFLMEHKPTMPNVKDPWKWVECVLCPKCGRSLALYGTLVELVKQWNDGEGEQVQEFPEDLVQLDLEDDGTIPKEMVVQVICLKPEGVETTVEEIYRHLREMYGEEAVSRSREKLRRIFRWKDISNQSPEDGYK